MHLLGLKLELGKHHTLLHHKISTGFDWLLCHRNSEQWLTIVLLYDATMASPNLDHYRCIHFEVLDLMVNAIGKRFDQPSFNGYAKMESLLVNTLNYMYQDYSMMLQFIETNYCDDVDIGALNARLKVFKLLMKDGHFTCFYDMLAKIKELPELEKGIVNHIITICKLLLVNPATSASSERSFSIARRLKTWLR